MLWVCDNTDISRKKEIISLIRKQAEILLIIATSKHVEGKTSIGLGLWNVHAIHININLVMNWSLLNMVTWKAGDLRRTIIYLLRLKFGYMFYLYARCMIPSVYIQQGWGLYNLIKIWLVFWIWHIFNYIKLLEKTSFIFNFSWNYQ